MKTKLHKDDISQSEAHTNINWEKRRYEIAKAMIPYIYLEDRNRGLSTHINTRNNYIYKDAKDCAEDAVRYADALIRILKEQSNPEDEQQNDTPAKCLTCRYYRDVNWCAYLESPIDNDISIYCEKLTNHQIDKPDTFDGTSNDDEF